MSGPPPSVSPFLITPEAAAFLRLSSRTLEAYRDKKKGPTYYKLGTGANARIVYLKEDLLAWVKEQNPHFQPENV